MSEASPEGKQQQRAVLCCVLQVWASAVISLLAFVVRQKKIISRRCLCFGKFSITQASSLPTAWDRWSLKLGRSYFCAEADIFPASFWLTVDNWEEKKLVAGQSLGNHKDLTIHFFIFSNQPVYYFTEFGHWDEKQFTVPIFVFIRIFKIMLGLFTIWNWWEGLFSLHETWDDFSAWELFWPADVICVTEAPCCPSSHLRYF